MPKLMVDDIEVAEIASQDVEQLLQLAARWGLGSVERWQLIGRVPKLAGGAAPSPSAGSPIVGVQFNLQIEFTKAINGSISWIDEETVLVEPPALEIR